MKKIVKIALAAILLLVLVVGGFLLGVYLQIFDVGTMNEKMKLYDMPIIGEFFVKPAPETEEASKEEASGKPKEEMTDSKLNPERRDRETDEGARGAGKEACLEACTRLQRDETAAGGRGHEGSR